MDMTDVGVALSGGAVASICTLLGAWIKARYSQTRLTGGVRVAGIPQPLAVSAQPTGCAERHADIKDDLSNIFARLAALEKAQAAYDATVQSLKSQIASMDGKLDRLLAAIK